MDYRRVRTIIPLLNYQALIDHGVIPDLDECFPPDVFSVKKYPPFVYQSRAFDHFGLLVDYLVRGALRINGKLDVFDEQNNEGIYYTTSNLNEMAEAARLIVKDIYGTETFSKEEIQSYISTLVNITKSLMVNWREYNLTGLTLYNAKLTFESIQGHPDIIIGDTVLDIKMTGSFRKMKEESYLQILIYWAISECTTVGLVLPNQRLVVVADLSEISKSSFRHILANLPNKQITNSISSSIPHLGSTIHKGEDLSKSVLSVSPCQVFVSNARSGKMNKDIDTQARKAGLVIRDHQIHCYIHAPYTINLCNPPEDDNYQMKCLTKNLEVGRTMGALGVVVHTGARKKTELNEAMDMMEENVRTVLLSASIECPLLLETPCGEGTEVVTTKEELNDFFNCFSFDEKCKLRLCLDTCHTFVSGIDPLEYIEWWLANSDIPIGLIHFNDSQAEFGSHKDRHASYGTGFIGKEKLSMIYQLCDRLHIDMVTE